MIKLRCLRVSECVKLSIIFTSMVTLLSSMLLIGVGSFTLVRRNEFLPDLGFDLAPFGIYAVVFGAILFLVAFGCFGAITGNRSLLTFYFIILLITVLTEIAILIYAFVSRSSFHNEIAAALSVPFTNVNRGIATPLEVETVDSIQRIIRCCGLNGTEFWTQPDHHDNNTVPASCCLPADNTVNNTTVTMTTTCLEKEAYSEGCVASSVNTLQDIILPIISIVTTTTLFQTVGIVLSGFFRNEARKGSTPEEQTLEV